MQRCVADPLDAECRPDAGNKILEKRFCRYRLASTSSRWIEVDRPPPQLKRRNTEGAATSPLMNIEIINICSVFPFKNSNTCNLAPTRSFDVIPLSYFIPKHNLGRLCIFGVAQNLINERFAIALCVLCSILIPPACRSLDTS